MRTNTIMRNGTSLVFMVLSLLSFACRYIVLPEGIEASNVSGKGTDGWSAVATNISQSDNGNLHIDIAVRNDTGDWSAMKATEGKPAVLTIDGNNKNCDTVFVNSGGHRLAPGFQMRGYTAGTKYEPETQLIYVECPGEELTSGSMLSIPYSYVTGQYNYYEQDKNQVDGILEINLDEIASGLTYPMADSMDGLIQQPDIEIVALNKVVLSLLDTQRIENGLQFKWQTTNPGEYPTYVHIGNPPVIGEDGILYGFYETPDIVDVPITPAGESAEWTTEVPVPEDVKGFYTLLSVETGKARLFQNYAVDISDK